MKNKIFTKKNYLNLGVVLLFSIAIIILSLAVLKPKYKENTESIAVKSVSSEILSDGSVTAFNQASLHFQTNGKLTYLPVKEGDTVYQGQTIASLDSTTLQKQLAQALNTYQVSRDTFDQTQANSTNNLLQNQQKVIAGAAGITGSEANNIITETVKRIVDQNQANLNNTVLNVEIANQALQLSSIVSPLNGIITHLDISTINVNVTPANSFTVADPNTLVFRSNIYENDIDFISEGSTAIIKFNNEKKLSGTVSKIYPDKITLANGQKVYQVDIDCPDLLTNSKLGQSGTALITSNNQSKTKLIPSWTILNHDSVWVISNGRPTLKHIATGKTHGDVTEIISGLSEKDQVVLNPISLVAKKYRIL